MTKEDQLIYLDDFVARLSEAGFTLTDQEKLSIRTLFSVDKDNKQLSIETIEKVLQKLGVKNGLPEPTKFLNTADLNIRCYRMINKIFKFMNDKNITNFIDVIKPEIKVVEVVANNKTYKVDYILDSELQSILKMNGISKDIELDEKLQFWLWVSSETDGFKKIMVKKLQRLLDICKHNAYVKHLTHRRPDPYEKEDEEEPINDGDGEGDDFDEYDISDEDERMEKKRTIHIQMMKTRKERKTTKKNLP